MGLSHRRAKRLLDGTTARADCQHGHHLPGRPGTALRAHGPLHAPPKLIPNRLKHDKLASGAGHGPGYSNNQGHDRPRSRHFLLSWVKRAADTVYVRHSVHAAGLGVKWHASV